MIQKRDIQSPTMISIAIYVFVGLFFLTTLLFFLVTMFRLIKRRRNATDLYTEHTPPMTYIAHRIRKIHSFPTHAHLSETSLKCVICLEDCKENEVIRSLSCHDFHAKVRFYSFIVSVSMHGLFGVIIVPFVKK
jgi:hypothetical protein